ncbi:SDR family oxidoreductase [Horticoccus luteus]|uniref:SDR family oxidoreductase n=1 Tax=Horticoccus luteus TaxID=2862869 RepID=A0A8F9TYQ8_9BACT|nr:SDR family oxidoreductase [Horticoccus luteus]QYM80457.1 SDR family oxidoreductase [Horticoccus luteus]
MSLSTALVTGASRGIGRAIAQHLATRGVTVALHYATNRIAAEALRDSLPGSGHLVLQADLSRDHAPAELWHAAHAALGRVDLLINNAGVYTEHAVVDSSVSLAFWSEAWAQTLATNLVAPAHLMFHAARTWQECGSGGRIVNISSRGAFRGEPRAPAYGASKAGLNALGQSLAKALAPQHIYVFTVAPGWVETDMATEHLAGSAGRDLVRDIPLGRVATPEEIAQLTVWLGLDAPASLTGCIVDANGASYLRT